MSHPPPFERVYKEFSERIYYACLAQVHNVAVAEDLAAETFLAAYVAYERTKPTSGMVAPWLFRIARNLVTDHRRKERRRDRINQLLGRATAGPRNIEDIASTNSELAEMLGVISQLKARDQRLLSLRVFGELTNREVGQVMGMSEIAAMSAVHRALQRFRSLREKGS